MIISVMVLITYMQDCIKNVDTKAVITVNTKFAILLIVSRFITLKF